MPLGRDDRIGHAAPASEAVEDGHRPSTASEAVRPREYAPFVVRARPMGARAALDYDRIATLIEELDGVAHH